MLCLRRKLRVVPKQDIGNNIWIVPKAFPNPSAGLTSCWKGALKPLGQLLFFFKPLPVFPCCKIYILTCPLLLKILIQIQTSKTKPGNPHGKTEVSLEKWDLGAIKASPCSVPPQLHWLLSALRKPGAALLGPFKSLFLFASVF